MGRNMLIKKLLLLAFMIMTITFLSAGCVTNQEYIKEGNKYTKSGNWDEAVTYYQELHDKYPDDKEIKLVLARSKIEASIAYLASGKALLEKNLFDQAVSEFQQSYKFNPSNRLTLVLIKRAKKEKQVLSLIKKGENLIETGDIPGAKNAFQKAAKLDPKNNRAQKYLAGLSAKEKQLSLSSLKIPSKKPVSFKFKNTSIINVFEVLSKLSGINFIFDKEMVNSKVTMFMTDVSLNRFINVLLKTNNLAAKLINDNTMLIYPNTPAKKKEYEDLKIRTFYLANLDAQKAVSLLTKILKSRNIIANKELNAIVIRGQKEEIEIASKIIEANDRPPAEVLLNVEILEVSRTKEKQLGLELDPASVSIGVGEASDKIDDDAGIINTASSYALQELSDKEIMLSIPTATLHLLKQDGDTRILANPQIRVKNNEKASIHIGERIPIRTNRRVDTNGDITYDYQYQDVGVKLDAVPSINMNGEISLKINLTVRDGEPIIIGGLIRDDELETLRKIPYLSEIPGIGRLFTNEGRNDTQTDILMSITPILLQEQKIPGKDITEMWSGNEGSFSLQEPFRTSCDNGEWFLETPEEIIKEKKEKPTETKQTEKKINSIEPDQPEKTNQSKKNTAKAPIKWQGSTPFSIHVNSFPTIEEAENRIKELTGLGYEYFMVHVDVPDKGSYYRIFTGRFKNYSSAQATCNEYKSRKEFADDIHPVTRKWAFTGLKE
ncbi:MAG: SPOR domain-containing protein [Deltaproteobacteria bacterium]|nr:SPOR domain-containing protein [Deltaproteobacteria bacterium]